MCGIMGVVSRSSQPDTGIGARIREAARVLRHRGPDDEGFYQDVNVWLAHTRLSILDLSSAGHQPMQSACGRFVISYNGEVYNFRELASKHGLDHLRSGSDTEVVLELFVRFGVASLQQLNGMFAFCVYDRVARKMWLVRDRLGIKPLYYRLDASGLAFASEIKGIHALVTQPPTCDVASLGEWLYYGNSLGENTLYDGVRQLLPGCCLEIDTISFEHAVREYWSLRQHVDVEQAAAADTHERAVEQTRRLLEQAVQRQIVSDVPVGVFLSGGVDSSAIAAFASRHYQGRLATYSVGFDFAKDGGELPKAKRVASLYGTEHHEIHIAGEHVSDLVEKMVAHYDSPFADAANIPLYLMAARISAQTKVVLQGDGGDELFGGYRRYVTLKYHRLLHPLSRILLHVNALTPQSAMHYRIQRYLRAFAAPDLATTMALLVTAEDRDDSPSSIFSPGVSQTMDRTDPLARIRRLHALFESHDIGNRMSLVDLLVVLPDIYLQKVDRATMAASLEVRVPFLDHDLVDYVVRLPGSSKMPLGRKKWLLKSALKGIVPDEILFGPKTGFSVPYGKWLQTSLKPLFFDHLAQFVRRRPDMLDVARINDLFSRTTSGRQNHSSILWKLLNFLIWSNNTNVSFTGQSVN
ncbi:MAG TPA: asparagine synthase (glutamine-hydrolyzing) [Steroidobacter sp.]|uniref:asparagine synthase (glutamine-hydrolyzing) n=1 Tax=Steroidobacter sp. TaxID=1978227 RepID=UPI002EDB19CD